jgi:hypothetical protein
MSAMTGRQVERTRHGIDGGLRTRPAHTSGATYTSHQHQTAISTERQDPVETINGA